MKCELNTKWHKGETYSAGELPVTRKPIQNRFYYKPYEMYKIEYRYDMYIDDPEICFKTTPLEEEILMRVALGKYMTVPQIVGFMQLEGLCVGEKYVATVISQMEKKRLLMRFKAFIPNELDTNVFYGINFWGMLKIREDLENIFHSKIAWYPWKDREKRGIVKERPSDVQRILQGNQIVLDVLAKKVPIERFGFLETFRPEGDNVKPPFFTPTLNIQFHEENVMAIEVVRDFSSQNACAYRELSSKVYAYYKMKKDEEYYKQNYHNYKVYPELIICGENENHNRKIKRFLKHKHLWNKNGTTIYFMEDGMSSFYEIDDHEQIIWHEFGEKEEETNV